MSVPPTIPGDINVTAISVERVNVGEVVAEELFAPLITDGVATLENGTLSDLVDPTLPQDAATKNYVDNFHELPTGGLTGEVLTKASNANYDIEWAFPNASSNILTVAISGAQFTSIAAALASITDNSILNRYLISVGPGIFTEPTLTMKPYVDVIGTGNITTVVTNSPNQHAIVGSDHCLIESLIIQGAIGTGFCAIYHESATGNDTTALTVRKVIFGNNDTLVKAYGNVGWANVTVIDCTVGGNSQFNYGFIATNNANSIPGTILVSRCEGSSLNSPNPITFFNVSGINCMLTLDSILATPTALEVGTTFATFSNGGQLQINSALVQRWDNGIVSLNIGTNPIIIVNDVVISMCNTDINLIHPGTVGTIDVNADRHKVTSASNVSFFIRTTDFDGILFNGPLYYTPSAYNDITDITATIVNTPTMGVVSGGELSAGLGLNILIAAGVGYQKVGTPPNDLLKKREWVNSSLLLPANSSVYVYMNQSGVFVNNANYPDTINNILFGKVVTNASVIQYIQKIPLDAYHYSNANNLMLQSAIGPVFSSGCNVSENVTPFELDVTLGIYFFTNLEFTPTGGVPITFDFYYRSAVPGVFTVVPAQTVINNTDYDDGTGTLAPLTASFYTKHLLLTMGGPGEVYLIICGQAEYATQGAAEAGSLPLPPTFVSDSFVRLASIVIQQGAANIISIIDERPRIGFASSSTTGSTNDHAALFGLASSTAHPQYLLRDGTQPMTGNLDLNSSSIININNVGANTGNFTDTTQSTSTITGALKTLGGLGVAKNAYIGELLNIQGNFEMKGSVSGQLTHAVPSAVTSYTLTWPSTVSGVNGYVLSSLTDGTLSWAPGIDYSAPLVLTNTTQSTSPTTGALTSAGGVGIAKNLNIQGNFGMYGSVSGQLIHSIPSVVTPYTLTWPSTVAASNGQFLSSTTGGTLSWETAAGVESGMGILSSTSVISGYTNMGQLRKYPVKSMTAMPVARSYGMACTNNNKIYYGSNSGAAFYSYDPVLDTWSILATGPFSQIRMPLLTDGVGDFIYTAWSQPGNQGFLSRYSISGGTWTSALARPPLAFNDIQFGASGYFTAASTGFSSDRLYFMRGAGTAGWIYYDINSDTWSAITVAGPANQFAGGVAIGNTLYFIGGNFAQQIFALNVVTGVITSNGVVASLNYGRNYPAVCAIGTKIYVVGGSSSSGVNTPAEVYDTTVSKNSVSLFDINTTIQGTGQAASIGVVNGKTYIYVLGGVAGSITYNINDQIDPTEYNVQIKT